MRVALVQLNSSDDPDANLSVTLDFVRGAVAGGADIVLTPEVTNCVSASRARQHDVLETEPRDPTLAALRSEACSAGVPILVGSLALKTDDPDGRFANRSVMIGPDGATLGSYDKIHMFDVDVSATETYRESSGYRPGDTAVTCRAAGATWGLTICYDLRFPALFRALARAGAQIISVPSAFSPVTGHVHWRPLLQARAIETGCFVVAAAQTGTHAAANGRSRQTHGHSLAVSPWGEVIIDAGTEPGVTFAEIDLAAVDEARRRVPSLLHDRPFAGP